MDMQLNLPKSPLRTKVEEGKTYVFCLVRKKFLVATPEEWVRQHLISFLNTVFGYPISLMKIEKRVKGSVRIDRADLIVCDPQGEAKLLVECKAPDQKLDRETFFQLGRYNRHVNAQTLLISNGMEHYCCQVGENGDFVFLKEIPAYK